MRSTKVCTYDDCGMPLFARGYCLLHYKTEYLAKKSKTKKRTPVKKATAKRLKQTSEYVQARLKFIEETREADSNKKIYCYFCGNEIYSHPDLHHLRGRDNEMLLFKPFWKLVHPKCHFVYHNYSAAKITWFAEYLEHIKKDYPGMYFYESNKLEKQ